MCLGEVVAVEPAAGGGAAGAARQDTVRQDREHKEPAALARTGTYYIRGKK